MRLEKIGQMIQRELSSLILRETRDPRLQSVSITLVEPFPDLSGAKVFFTVPDLQYRVATEEALKKAAGFFRSQLASQSTLRRVPKLYFHYDESILRGEYLTHLIDSVCSEPEKKSETNGED